MTHHPSRIDQTITKTPTNTLPAQPKPTHRKISPTSHQIIDIKNPPSPYTLQHAQNSVIPPWGFKSSTVKLYHDFNGRASPHIEI
ncbi:hypothetical protein ACJA88_010281 [Fusarium oxysporum]